MVMPYTVRTLGSPGKNRSNDDDGTFWKEDLLGPMVDRPFGRYASGVMICLGARHHLLENECAGASVKVKEGRRSTPLGNF